MSEGLEKVRRLYSLQFSPTYFTDFAQSLIRTPPSFTFIPPFISPYLLTTSIHHSLTLLHPCTPTSNPPPFSPLTHCRTVTFNSLPHTPYHLPHTNTSLTPSFSPSFSPIITHHSVTPPSLHFSVTHFSLLSSLALSALTPQCLIPSHLPSIHQSHSVVISSSLHISLRPVSTFLLNLHQLFITP